MKRTIIHIDEEKCSGCGLCAAACHENAIGMVNGKAKLLRDDYCDGLGDCLPACPAGAITFEEREAAAYDHAAVLAHKAEALRPAEAPCGCPGSQARPDSPGRIPRRPRRHGLPAAPVAGADQAGPGQRPVFRRREAADCRRLHRLRLRLLPPGLHPGQITLVGCPKLDSVDYAEKLTEILAQNDIKSVTVVRMEVPCCGGLEHAAQEALKNSGKFIPWQVVTISTDGRILD
jgi:NAD-dependent dihydropyrimidine dehydrogenase PreA subunit